MAVQHGIVVCINSDDPVLFDSQLSQEWLHCLKVTMSQRFMVPTPQDFSYILSLGDGPDKIAVITNERFGQDTFFCDDHSPPTTHTPSMKETCDFNRACPLGTRKDHSEDESRKRC